MVIMLNKNYIQACKLKPGDKFIVPSCDDIEYFYNLIVEEKLEDTVGWTHFASYADTERTIVKIDSGYDTLTNQPVPIIMDTSGVWWDSRMIFFEVKSKNPCVSW